jgi:2-dehydropantoate 2-reductase
MRYLILGAGALGGFFGAMLLRGRADVTFLVRPKRAAQLQRDGLVIKTQDGGEIRTRVKAIEQGQLGGTYDVVLLCCKAYDLNSAMDAFAPAMSEQSVILPLLNGVRHIDILTHRFGRGRVLGGLTVINAALLPDGAIQQSQLRINLNMIGELDGRSSTRCTAIKNALDAGGISTQISDNILSMMWAKFFGFV